MSSSRIVLPSSEVDLISDSVLEELIGMNGPREQENPDSPLTLSDITVNAQDFEDVEYNNDFDDVQSTRSSLEYMPNGYVESVQNDFADQRDYEWFLKSYTTEIDHFLMNANRGRPSDNMIRFADYDWQYSGMSLGDSHRLSKLRYFVERYKQQLKEKAKEHYWGIIDEYEKRAVLKRPVCAICLYDLRSDFPLLSRLHMLNCGHSFHRYCIKKHFLKYHQTKCPTCNVACSFSDGRTTYINYS